MLFAKTKEDRTSSRKALFGSQAKNWEKYKYIYVHIGFLYIYKYPACIYILFILVLYILFIYIHGNVYVGITIKDCFEKKNRINDAAQCTHI